MKRNLSVTGINITGLFRLPAVSPASRRGAGVALLAALGLLPLGACRNEGNRADSMRDSVVSRPRIQADDFDTAGEMAEADNDIAMTVRSVADAINVGEAIDSVDYSFRGVLTDGSGMPLFTNIDGLPGQWEVEVISPSVVQIRNLNTGNLVADELVDYLSAALQLDDDDSLQLVSNRESPERKVSVFTFGRGTITIESSPVDDTDGEPGEKMLITMRANHELREPAAEPDSVSDPVSVSHRPAAMARPGRNAPAGHPATRHRANQGFITRK